MKIPISPPSSYRLTSLPSGTLEEVLARYDISVPPPQGFGVACVEDDTFLFVEPVCSVILGESSHHVVTGEGEQALTFSIDALLDAFIDFSQKTPEVVIPYAVALFSYELLHHYEDVPRPLQDMIGAPLSVLYFHKRVVRHNKKDNSCVECLFNYDSTMTSLWSLEPATSAPGTDTSRATPPSSSMLSRAGVLTEGEYLEAVRTIKNHIVHGEVYQANLCQLFALSFRGDPLSLWKILQAISPAPRGAFLQTESRKGEPFSLLSNSPERFFDITGKTIVCSPIKGTRPRSQFSDKDAKLRNELLRSEKERAELAMVVDVVRNDLGRICEMGSISVREHAKVQSFTHVHHLLSDIVGTLVPKILFSQILRALFPSASITGAPKIAAMKILRTLEPYPRGAFCGSIGVIGKGFLRMNVAIRTAQLCGEKLFFSAGSGVTIDSVPEEEYAESLLKAYAVWIAYHHERERFSSIADN